MELKIDTRTAYMYLGYSSYFTWMDWLVMDYCTLTGNPMGGSPLCNIVIQNWRGRCDKGFRLSWKLNKVLLVQSPPHWPLTNHFTLVKHRRRGIDNSEKHTDQVVYLRWHDLLLAMCGVWFIERTGLYTWVCLAPSSHVRCSQSIA